MRSRTFGTMKKIHGLFSIIMILVSQTSLNPVVAAFTITTIGLNTETPARFVQLQHQHVNELKKKCYGQQFFTRLHSSLGSSGGAEANNKNVDPILRLPLMEAELAVLLGNEKSFNDNNIDNNSNGGDDFGGTSGDTSNLRKFELQQAIQDAETAAEFGVRRAQVDFYDAFSNRDVQAMKQVWSSGKADDNSASSPPRCIHPGMASLEGIDNIMKSWEQIFNGAGGSGGAGGFTISPTNVKINICGPTAICSCVEETTPGGGELEALNIYRREDGQWRMILHMASPIIMPRGGSAMF